MGGGTGSKAPPGLRAAASAAAARPLMAAVVVALGVATAVTVVGTARRLAPDAVTFLSAGAAAGGLVGALPWPPPPGGEWAASWGGLRLRSPAAGGEGGVGVDAGESAAAAASGGLGGGGGSPLEAADADGGTALRGTPGSVSGGEWAGGSVADGSADLAAAAAEADDPAPDGGSAAAGTASFGPGEGSGVAAAPALPDGAAQDGGVGDEDDGAPWSPAALGDDPWDAVSSVKWGELVAPPPPISTGAGGTGGAGGPPPPLEALERWHHKSVRRVNNLILPFCRFHTACQLRNGSVALPSWMAAHHTWVGRCGIRRPLYVLGNPAAEARLHLIRSSRYAALDLLSPAPLRTHMPHFLSDAIAPLVFMDLLAGSRWEGAATRYCATASGAACEPDVVPATANLALYLERGSFNNSWVTSFARLMAKAGEAPPLVRAGDGTADGTAPADAARPIRGMTFLDRERGFALGATVGPASTAPTGVCFRSILSTAHVFWRMPRSALRDANPFFAAARQPRTSRLEEETAAVTAATANAATAAAADGGGGGAADGATAGRDAAAAAAAAPCAIHMTLNSRAGERQLVQTKELAAAITALAAGHNHFFAPPRVDVTVSEAHFENMTFAAQRAAMRATDVLVASHGAGLTNVVFLRPGTSVIEVYPFAYTAELFAQLAEFLGLPHTAVVAAADSHAYKACVAAYNGAADAYAAGGVLPPPLAAAFAEWDAAVADGNTGPGRLRLERADNDGPVRRRRWCVRRQSLVVDVPAVAKAAWERGLALCTARGTGGGGGGRPPPPSQFGSSLGGGAARPAAAHPPATEPMESVTAAAGTGVAVPPSSTAALDRAAAADTAADGAPDSAADAPDVAAAAVAADRPAAAVAAAAVGATAHLVEPSTDNVHSYVASAHSAGTNDF